MWPQEAKNPQSGTLGVLKLLRMANSMYEEERYLPNSDLTYYEVARYPIKHLPDDEELEITEDVLAELKCVICFEILKEPHSIAQCLHRFCADCLNSALRSTASSSTTGSANLHCVVCRGKMSSKRDSGADTRYQGLVEAISARLISDDAHIMEVDPVVVETPPPKPQSFPQLSIVFVLQPYRQGGVEPLPVISRLFFRAPCELLMSELALFVCGRVGLRRGEVELVMCGGTGTVVLDGGLGLGQVVEAFWTLTAQLTIYYRRRTHTYTQRLAGE